MKKNFLFACLLFTGMLSAQIVNIPDANFKNFLVNVGTGNLWNVAKNASGNYVKIDTNNDGQIQVSEALVIRSINIYQQTFSSVEGIEAFTNLKTLWVRYSPIISINLSSLTSLEELYCNDNQLSALNLSNLTNLKRLNCGGNNFTTLNLNGLANLQELKCNGLNLTSLDLSEVPNLKVLQCAHNHLASIALDGLTLLEELSVRGNPLTALNVSGCTALKILETTETQLQALDISALLNLNEAKCGYTYSLESVNIGYHPNMTMFDCTLTNVESLNLSGCPILQSLMCASTSKLQYVNIKNGPQITWVDTYHNNYNRFLCVDEGEELSLPSHIYLSNVNVNSYCTFTPGGVYNTIAGTFTFDGDGNGCSESDTAARNIKIGINDGSQTGLTVKNNGNYFFYTQAGNYTLTPQFENNWFTATPATATVNFANNNNNTATQNFCIAPNGVHPDVEVVLVPENGAQPGFDARYKIVYKNKGNQMLSGNVVLNFDESILDYVPSGSTAPTSTASGQLTWAYSDLLPFESRTINVTLNLNGPMETPPVNLDDVLNYTVSITPATGDETPADNTFTIKPDCYGFL